MCSTNTTCPPRLFLTLCNHRSRIQKETSIPFFTNCPFRLLSLMVTFRGKRRIYPGIFSAISRLGCYVNIFEYEGEGILFGVKQPKKRTGSSHPCGQSTARSWPNCVNYWLGLSPHTEAECLGVIGAKVLTVFLLAIHSHGFYSPSPPRPRVKVVWHWFVM